MIIKLNNNKMKTIHTIKQTVLVLAAILIGFASCNNDDVPNINTENKSVAIRISSDASTRGVSDPLGGGTEVTFNKGNLYFSTAAGTIIRHYTIGSGAGFDIQLAAITSANGHIIENVPFSASTVTVVANSVGSNNTAGGMNAVNQRVVDVISQYDIENANLFGTTSTLTATGTVNPNTGNEIFNCVIELRPTVARIEITQIRAGDVGTTINLIESFTLAGIYIDNFYRNATIDGSTLTNLISGNQTASNFVPNGGNYAFDVNNSVHDVVNITGNASNNLTVAPETGVWAYNLFANARVPHIVFHLTNVRLRLEDGSEFVYPNDQFLTVRGIINDATNERITQILQGNIYNLADLIVFNQTHLDEVPNRLFRDVNVSIQLARWSEILGRPIF